MTLILSGTDGLSDIDGSAATPAIRGTDTNTGIFFPAADTVAVATGGTERVRVDSSGNVGIGTSSPAYKLDVSGGGGSIATARVINGNVGGSDGAQILLGNSANFTNAYFRLNGGGNSSQAGIGSLNIGVTESVPMAFYTNNTERARITSGGDFQFNSGYGSVATAYGCRAWVNFNGTGVVAIRASGNVTSITDNGTGNYTANFTTSMPDANFSFVGTLGHTSASGWVVEVTKAAGSIRLATLNASGAVQDTENVNVAIFR